METGKDGGNLLLLHTDGFRAMAHVVWDPTHSRICIVEPGIESIQFLCKGSRIWALDRASILSPAHHGVKRLPSIPHISPGEPLLHSVLVVKLGNLDRMLYLFSEILDTLFVSLNKS